MNEEFLKIYMDNLINEIGELHKLRILDKTKIAFLEKSLNDLNNKKNEVQEAPEVPEVPETE